MTLPLRNPHSVLAALEHRPHDVLEVRVPPQRPSDSWSRVVEVAKAHGVPVRTALGEERSAADRRGPKFERTSVACAEVRPRSELPLDDVLTGANEQPFGLWLALDCLQDPHNVGAILRTAAFFGVRGVLLTKDRSAPLTGVVYDVASGGMETVRWCTVPNLAAAMKTAKDAGLWILGSSEHSERDVADVPRDRSWLLVIGNEEQGLRRLTLDRCDETCGIQPRGSVTSLNASVAAAVMISTLLR